MPKPLPNDHIHSWVRWKKFFGEFSFKCAHPDCTKTAKRSFLKGKRSLCPLCKKETFILTLKDLNLRTPRCPACSNSNENKVKRALENVLGGILDAHSPTGGFDR